MQGIRIRDSGMRTGHLPCLKDLLHNFIVHQNGKIPCKWGVSFFALDSRGWKEMGERGLDAGLMAETRDPLIAKKPR
jgi:hypothetical protein